MKQKTKALTQMSIFLLNNNFMYVIIIEVINEITHKEIIVLSFIKCILMYYLIKNLNKKKLRILIKIYFIIYFTMPFLIILILNFNLIINYCEIRNCECHTS